MIHLVYLNFFIVFSRSFLNSFCVLLIRGLSDDDDDVNACELS